MKDIPAVPARLKDKYKEVFQIDPSWIIKSAAHRGKWVDQSQSLNIYFAGTSGRELANIYEYAWSLGLKTTYYLRSLGASQVEKSTVNASEFGSTHKRDAGADAQASAIGFSSGIVASQMAIPDQGTVQVHVEKEVVSIRSEVVPIPSFVTTVHTKKSEQAVMAQKPQQKYKITVMPEATCDGCQ